MEAKPIFYGRSVMTPRKGQKVDIVCHGKKETIRWGYRCGVNCPLRKKIFADKGWPDNMPSNCDCGRGAFVIDDDGKLWSSGKLLGQIKPYWRIKFVDKWADGTIVIECPFCQKRSSMTKAIMEEVKRNGYYRGKGYEGARKKNFVGKQ